MKQGKFIKITIVAGARPNFMKIAPIIKTINNRKDNGVAVDYNLIHTGQHYDKKMSDDFFEELSIPKPDINLGAGGGSQAEQTAAIMVRFEKELQKNRPNVVLVVGDVNSTFACAITAKKLCVDVVHVEAGMRSGDMTMPEEINRIVTDAICDHYFTTSEIANQNLRHSGVPEYKIHFVGNTMIDSLYQNLNQLKKPEIWDQYQLNEGGYFLITLHRPVNVDKGYSLKKILDVVLEVTSNDLVVFPVHPRTKNILDSIGYSNDRLIQTEPMSYLEFIYLLKNAKAVITDSGGITEEATVLNVPCLTLGDTTERPETITIGTNELVGTNPLNLKPYINKIQEGKWKSTGIPLLWDGKTAERIVEKLIELYLK